jgi:uncharacterized protein YlaI
MELQCNTCSAKCSTVGKLFSHAKEFHNRTTNLCSLCPGEKKTLKERTFRRHMLGNHAYESNSLFQCHECGERIKPDLALLHIEKVSTLSLGLFF